ncbi:MAG: hypothetical protein U9R19_05985 [Bacteroidota bacterium]|nr:hypothetical protein [Bacteroidota bacterium]
MNLILLFRILLENRYLLVVGGVFMATVIFFGTRYEEKIYSTSSVVYTGIATGFNIESGSNQRFDLFGTNAKFDNLINIIKSRETQEETGIQLLATHLIADKTNQQSFTHLQRIIPDSVRSQLVDVTSVENTVRNLKNLKIQSDSNIIYRLLYSGDKFYSIKQISKVSVRRIQSSDLIQLDYSCSNPDITQQTLQKLIEVFMKKYTSLKSGQTHTVVGYFEDRVRESLDRLAKAEKDMLEFKERNRIINYYEQTKFIAEQKEDLDKEYQDEVMALASARAALAELESRVSVKTSISLQSDKILEKRAKLAKLSSKIAMADVYQKGNFAEIAKWNKEAEILKNSLRNDVENLDTYGRSTSGIPLNELLKQWLENAIIVEETEAKAIIIQKRKVEFNLKYDKFAPLGSELSRIEREISISEKEYLNNLHSLNQSKLKQQNIALSSNIKILDPPFYPLRPKASIRNMLIVVGFIIGLVLVAGVLILLEFLDNTIKSPERVTEFTKLKLLGVFPKLLSKKKSIIDFKYISNRLVEIMIQKIKLEALNTNVPKGTPFQINITSNRENEGKTFITNLLVEKLRTAGNKVIIISPVEEEAKYIRPRLGMPKLFIFLSKTLKQLSSKLLPAKNNKKSNDDFLIRIECSDTYFYEINNDFFDLKSYNALLQFDKFSIKSTDYVFFILPALLNNEFPADLARKGNLSLFLCRANRNWSKADTKAMELYQNSMSHNSTVILNGARVDFLDSMIGEIPKKRTWRRRLAKKILTFDFWSHNKI